MDVPPLKQLVAHRGCMSVHEPIQQVHALMREKGWEFLVLLDSGRVRGICSVEEMGRLLASRYGWSLYAKKACGDHLLRPALVIRDNCPVPDLLEMAFSRHSETFYDDVVLTDAGGQLLGLIPMQKLIQLQNELFRDQISQLEQQRQILDENNRRMLQELQMARELQLSLLPPQGDQRPSAPPIHFGYRFEAAGEVSGDFLQVLEPAPHQLGLLLCDVMGHGVRSALISAMIRTLVSQLSELHGEPGELLTRMNELLFPILQQEEHPLFITAVCMVADSARGELRFARAGHHLPVKLRAGFGAREIVAPAGRLQPAIGFFERERFDCYREALEPECSYVLFTDGLFEAEDVTGQEVGHSTLLSLLEKNLHLPVEECMSQTLNEVRERISPRGFDDDVCLAALVWQKDNFTQPQEV